MNKFELGEEVTWSSGAQGVIKTKVGVIVEVVSAGRLPDRTRFGALYRRGVGSARDHVTYVVESFDPTGKSSVRKIYWPRTSALNIRFAKEDGAVGGRKGVTPPKKSPQVLQKTLIESKNLNALNAILMAIQEHQSAGLGSSGVKPFTKGSLKRLALQYGKGSAVNGGDIDRVLALPLQAMLTLD